MRSRTSRWRLATVAVAAALLPTAAAAFSLPELSPDFRADVPLLAYKDGAAIRDGFGPTQVVVPNELRQARWVRQVECIRLVRAGRTAS